MEGWGGALGGWVWPSGEHKPPQTATRFANRIAILTGTLYYNASATACTMFDVPKTPQPHSMRIMSDNVPTR